MPTGILHQLSHSVDRLAHSTNNLHPRTRAAGPTALSALQMSLKYLTALRGVRVFVEASPLGDLDIDRTRVNTRNTVHLHKRRLRSTIAVSDYTASIHSTQSVTDKLSGVWLTTL